MIKHNLIANLAGSAWSALMGLAFVPFYINLMGAESYGIVGVLVSLQGMLAVLDLGLSHSMTREMARLSMEHGNRKLMADTARTLEVIYWAIALGVVVIIVLLSNFIAYHWLNPMHLSRESLLQALWIMALVIGLRWPVTIYMGGLNGLQRQVLVNTLMAIFATLQGMGALAVLWLIEPTVQAFFLWQALIALVQVVALRIALWRSFSSEYKGEFSKEVLRNIWRFTVGMSGIALTGVIITQIDKVLLSKMLTLAEFGYYTFAATIAAVVYRIIGPVFTAYYPRLTELVSKGDPLGLVRTYHQGCQLMAVTILPATLVLAFFSKEILELWTHNSDVVTHSFLLVSLLVIGNALNGLLTLPYALQLAHGWVKLAFYMHVIDVIVLVPAIYFSTLRWGAVGAAGMWIVFNMVHILIGIQLIHQRLLVAEKSRWYVNDVGKILLAVLVVTGVAKTLMADELSGMAKILILVVTLGIATTAAIVSAESLRKKFSFQKFIRVR